MTTISLPALFGKWRVDPTDLAAVDRFGETELHFRNDGILIYTVKDETKDEIAILRFRVDGDVLITDQPSEPREERTRFGLTEDGRLFLDDGHGRAHYVRIQLGT